jgi:hypothetical protein
MVRDALAGTGIEVVGASPIDAYDARAPHEYRSAALLPGARGIIVAGSAGPALWRKFLADMERHPQRWDEEHPYDTFVASLLDRADQALAHAGVRFRRFEAAFHAPLRVNFVALAELAGLGSPSPFGLLVHETHGPWWALRGAWLVAAEVEPPPAHRPPCVGCAAPCVGGWDNTREIASAMPDVRARCVVGQTFRYDEDQIAYHYDRANAIARLRAPKGGGEGGKGADGERR